MAGVWYIGHKEKENKTTEKFFIIFFIILIGENERYSISIYKKTTT